MPEEQEVGTPLSALATNAVLQRIRGHPTRYRPCAMLKISYGPPIQQQSSLHHCCKCGVGPANKAIAELFELTLDGCISKDRRLLYTSIGPRFAYLMRATIDTRAGHNA